MKNNSQQDVVFDWIFAFPYFNGELPSGRRSWKLLSALFKHDPIFMKKRHQFCTVVSEALNTILVNKYKKLKEQFHGDIHAVYVEISDDGYISVHNLVTRKDVGFDAMNEQVALYLAIVYAVRIVGGEAYRKPFVCEKNSLLGNVEGMLIQDFENFIDENLIA